MWKDLKNDEILTDPRTGVGYRIARFLGEGGFSKVYEALREDTGERLAVKVLMMKHGIRQKAIERMVREAKTLLVLRHAHVVQVYAVARRDDGLIFMVMQLLKGRTLRELLQDLGPGGRVPVPWALRVGIGIAAGLEAIHEHAVHRDIKPENIHVDDSGWTCLFDLGAGMFPKESRLTTDGYTLGTLNYMSPEQLYRPTTIDGRSDLFSLGTILYEMLSGIHPLAVDGPLNADKMELGNQVIFRPYKPLAQVAPHVPRYLCQIVDRLLAKDPDARYQTAGLVWDLLTASLERYALDHQALPPASMDLLATLPRTPTPLDPALTPSLPTSTNPFVTLSLPELARVQEPPPSRDLPSASAAPSSSSQATEELRAFVLRPSKVLPFKDGAAPKRVVSERRGEDALALAQQAPAPQAPPAPELGSDQFARHAMLPSFDSMTEHYSIPPEEEASALGPEEEAAGADEDAAGDLGAGTDATPAEAQAAHDLQVATLASPSKPRASASLDTFSAIEAPSRSRSRGDDRPTGDRPTMVHRRAGVSGPAAVAVVVGTAAIVALGGLGAMRAMGLYASPRPAISAVVIASPAPSASPSATLSAPAASTFAPAPSASASASPPSSASARPRPPARPKPRPPASVLPEPHPLIESGRLF